MSFPNVRNNDHATSVEGAASVAERAPTQRMRLLAVYAQADPTAFPTAYDGLTDEEAATVGGLLGSCYWKRCGELRHLQLIEYTGETRTGKAGISRKISRITERGRAALRTGSEPPW